MILDLTRRAPHSSAVLRHQSFITAPRFDEQARWTSWSRAFTIYSNIGDNSDVYKSTFLILVHLATPLEATFDGPECIHLMAEAYFTVAAFTASPDDQLIRP